MVTRVTWPRVTIRVGTQRRPRRRVHGLGDRGGQRRQARARARASSSDIQTLNEWALEGRLEVTALSAGAYPSVATATSCCRTAPRSARGTARSSWRASELDDLRGVEIVTPGPLTTANRVLKLALGADVRTRDLPFDEVLDEVVSGRAEAGLADPRGPAHLCRRGLHKLLDLGVWWRDETGLPLPLGARRGPPRCRPARGRLGGARARRSMPGSPIARRRWRTRWGSAEASTRRPPTSSSPCT